LRGSDWFGGFRERRGEFEVGFDSWGFCEWMRKAAVEGKRTEFFRCEAIFC